MERRRATSTGIIYELLGKFFGFSPKRRSHFARYPPRNLRLSDRGYYSAKLLFGYAFAYLLRGHIFVMCKLTSFREQGTLEKQNVIATFARSSDAPL